MWRIKSIKLSGESVRHLVACNINNDKDLGVRPGVTFGFVLSFLRGTPIIFPPDFSCLCRPDVHIRLAPHVDMWRAQSKWRKWRDRADPALRFDVSARLPRQIPDGIAVGQADSRLDEFLRFTNRVSQESGTPALRELMFLRRQESVPDGPINGDGIAAHEGVCRAQYYCIPCSYKRVWVRFVIFYGYPDYFSPDFPRRQESVSDGAVNGDGIAAHEGVCWQKSGTSALPINVIVYHVVIKEFGFVLLFFMGTPIIFLPPGR
jgi:hypothetical protein